MADIRSFFAPKGGSQSYSQDKPKPQPTATSATKKAAARKRRVVDSDDDEEDEPPKKVTPEKTTPKTTGKSVKKEEKLEPTTTSSYFSNNGKNKIVRTASAKPKKVKPEPKVEEENYIDDDNDDLDLGIFAEQFKKNEDDYVEEPHDGDMKDFVVLDNEENEEEVTRKPAAPPATGKRKTLAPDEEEEGEIAKPKRKPAARKSSSSSNDEEKVAMPKKKLTAVEKKSLPSDGDGKDREKVTKPRGKPAAAKKRSLPSDDEDEDEGPRSKAKKPAAKRARAKKQKEEIVEDEEIKKILDSVPTVRAPTPPVRAGDAKKFNFRDFKARAAAPATSGSVELPEGEENCLTGLTFVFTGVLDCLSREDGQQLVKKYGGKITGGPSKKTSYVVLGADAGPRKLEIIKMNNLKTIGEEGLFQLIRTLPANGGDHAGAKANEAKKAEQEKKIREMAKNMDKETKSKGKEAAQKEADQLWTVKYAPTQIAQICGNKGQVQKLQLWLRNWPKNLKSGFQHKGSDESGAFRVVMIYGPPGIGKTSAAHLVAKLEGYDIVESNASDTRSKKLMEETLRGVLDNRSLMGYFAGDQKSVDASKQKLVLIMDEVDGMSAGDRGGVGQLAAVCKKTQIPIICICNERKLPKMKPFDHVTFDVPFKRPSVIEVRSRIMSIAYREGIKLPANVIDQLVEGTHSDIRQIINMLSTYSTTQSTMSFEEGKELAKAWEKHVVLKPWDIAQKLLGTEMFSPNSKKTLNDKIELYFNDHEFSYLMIQENYLKTNPARAGTFEGRERTYKLLELADNAAESISDGDLVDALIHGPQQQWSLMPVHGMFSTVRPSSYMYGGYGGSHHSFTQWLGMNSKQSKLGRYVKDIQSHIRLRASGDRHEVRQNYIPTFHNLIVKRLEREGKDVIPDAIQLMDDYFLTKEDWDAIVELGVGPMDERNVKIPTQTKAMFTRQYNQMSHPMPFMKAGNIFAPKISKRDVPDIEEAIVESEDEAAIGEENPDAKKAEEDAMDPSKDKYVKIPKKSSAKGKGKAAGEKPKAAKKAAAKPSSSGAATKGRGKTKKN